LSAITASVVKKSAAMKPRSAVLQNAAIVRCGPRRPHRFTVDDLPDTP